MCTAISYKTRYHYFGRNLDLEYHYHEQITVTPRNYPFVFRHQQPLTSHYAIIGMATIADDYPLYYEATNEAGLSIAALNFPDNAFYAPCQAGCINLAPFELIPWVLGRCATIAQAKEQLASIHLCDTPFSAQYPLSPLHWMISDRDESLVVECMRDGIHLHANPAHVLTNNPPFDYQMMNLNNYMHLSPAAPVNAFSKAIDLKPYSLGMGALGLPGDLSSVSRFVRAAFMRMNAQCKTDELSSVSQFFHMLQSVQQPRGCTLVRENEYEITLYSSCCNTDKGIYYYTTYENQQISAVDMHKEDLDSRLLIAYDPILTQQILYQNGSIKKPTP